MRRTAIQIGIMVLIVISGCTGAFGTDTPSISFESVGEEKGLGYEASHSRTMNAGAGVYVSDYNTDGWPDLLALGGTPAGSDGQRPILYRNSEGSFERSGALPHGELAGHTYSGALFFDYDNDGDDDLLLLAVKAQPTFLENDNGTYVHRDVGFDHKFAVPLGATTADYDGDGRLDVVVYQNGNWQNETPEGYRLTGEVTDDNGNPNYLYRWNGTGFERVEGAFEGTRWTLGASFVDLTGDDRPDVHFTNDYNNDIVYVNDGQGEFRSVVPGGSTNRNGMSSEVTDINRDGRPDIFVTNIYFNRSKVNSAYTNNYLRNVLGKRAKGNNVLINRPNDAFSDRASEYGVATGGWGWAAIAGDLDNDGDVDLIHATTEFTETFLQQSFKTTNIPSYYQYPAIWERTEEGFEQRNASKLGFVPTNGRGIARLDSDRDGDLDIVVSQWSEGEYKLYENTGANGHWIELSLRREDGPAIGSTVTVTAGKRNWTRVMNSRADYQSQDSRTVHVGLGTNETIDRIRIEWPDGTTTILRDVNSNARLVVRANGSTRRVDPSE